MLGCVCAFGTSCSVVDVEVTCWRHDAQDTTPLEIRVSEFLAEEEQFSRISDVRHQENLSNVLFFIQDARLRNELSGTVQFVPKDLEDERVRRH